MTPAEITRQIRAMGWEVDTLGDDRFKATCGNFSTPWRHDLISVLDDVQALKQRPIKKEGE